MASGKCKFFNADKGFGFIIPDTGGADVFIHAKDMRKSGVLHLDEGQRVTFETAPGKDGKTKAVNLSLVR